MTKKIKIVLTIIVLIIGSIIVTILKEEGTIKTGFWIVGTIGLLIWIIPVDYNQNSNIKVSENTNETLQSINNSTINQKQTEREILEDLYSKGILTKMECDEKINQLYIKQVQIEERQYHEAFQEELQKKIGPLITQIETLKLNNLLTEDEFNEKKIIIENNCRADLMDDISKGKVTIGSKEELEKSIIRLKDFNYLAPKYKITDQKKSHSIYHGITIKHMIEYEDSLKGELYLIMHNKMAYFKGKPEGFWTSIQYNYSDFNTGINALHYFLKNRKELLIGLKSKF